MKEKINKFAQIRYKTLEALIQRDGYLNLKELARYSGIGSGGITSMIASYRKITNEAILYSSARKRYEPADPFPPFKAAFLSCDPEVYLAAVKIAVDYHD